MADSQSGRDGRKRKLPTAAVGKVDRCNSGGAVSQLSPDLINAQLRFFVCRNNCNYAGVPPVC